MSRYVCVPMEHNPLSNSHLKLVRYRRLYVVNKNTYDTLLRLIQCRQLSQHSIVVVGHCKVKLNAQTELESSIIEYGQIKIVCRSSSSCDNLHGASSTSSSSRTISQTYVVRLQAAKTFRRSAETVDEFTVAELSR